MLTLLIQDFIWIEIPHTTYNIVRSPKSTMYGLIHPYRGTMETRILDWISSSNQPRHFPPLSSLPLRLHTLFPGGLSTGRCRSKSRQLGRLQVCMSPLVEVTLYSEHFVFIGTHARLCPSSPPISCPACGAALSQFGISLDNTVNTDTQFSPHKVILHQKHSLLLAKI